VGRKGLSRPKQGFNPFSILFSIFFSHFQVKFEFKPLWLITSTYICEIRDINSEYIYLYIYYLYFFISLLFLVSLLEFLFQTLEFLLLPIGVLT
jgi:hypothetical protein